MGELAQFTKMKITTCHLIKFPSGQWGFVGAVPEILAYDNPTAKQLQDVKFGARFGPKTRGFNTEIEAREFAKHHNCDII